MKCEIKWIFKDIYRVFTTKSAQFYLVAISLSVLVIAVSIALDLLPILAILIITGIIMWYMEAHLACNPRRL